jgi:hypothetical protein
LKGHFMPSSLPPIYAATLMPVTTELDVRGFSYEDRRAILPALAEALDTSGCWVHDRKAVSLAQMEFHFDMPLRSAVDLYSGLVGCGLELTRASHLELTGLCTLRHNPRPQHLGRVIGVRLEVSFLEEIETQPVPTGGHA